MGSYYLIMAREVSVYASSIMLTHFPLRGCDNVAMVDAMSATLKLLKYCVLGNSLLAVSHERVGADKRPQGMKCSESPEK